MPVHTYSTNTCPHIHYTHEGPINNVFFVTEMIDISSGSRKDAYSHTCLRAVSFFVGGRKQLFKRLGLLSVWVSCQALNTHLKIVLVVNATRYLIPGLQKLILKTHLKIPWQQTLILKTHLENPLATHANKEEHHLKLLKRLYWHQLTLKITVKH